MTNNPQEKSRLTPEHIKTLAKFFGLLWETQKELERHEHENQECEHYSSIAR